GQMQLALAATASTGGGGMLDPWGRPYRLCVAAPTKAGGGSIIIFSCGPDGVIDSSPIGVTSGATEGSDLIHVVARTRGPEHRSEAARGAAPASERPGRDRRSGCYRPRLHARCRPVAAAPARADRSSGAGPSVSPRRLRRAALSRAGRVLGVGRGSLRAS